MPGDAPAKDTPAEKIHNRRQIHPAIPGRQIGCISYPDLVAARGLAQLLKQVGAVAKVVLAVGSQRFETLPLYAFQVEFLHQPNRAVTPTVQPILQKMVVNRAMPIAASRFFVELNDYLFVLLVLLATGRGFGSTTAVISTRTHPERLAQLTHFMTAAVLIYESILHHSSLAK